MDEKRKCLECQRPIVGRSDKKFCSDACRNAYNNKIHAPATNFMRNVNSLLAKNRRILADLYEQGNTLMPKEELWKRGFDFDFYTSTLTTPTGDVYQYCYDMGYLLKDEGHVLLVERNDD